MDNETNLQEDFDHVVHAAHGSVVVVGFRDAVDVAENVQRAEPRRLDALLVPSQHRDLCFSNAGAV